MDTWIFFGIVAVGPALVLLAVGLEALTEVDWRERWLPRLNRALHWHPHWLGHWHFHGTAHRYKH